MAYATGSAADLPTLLNALRLFAVSNSWTVASWDQTQQRLFLNKGGCYVALKGGTYAYDCWISGVKQIYNDVTLKGSLCSAFVGGNTNYWGHTDSPVTADGQAARIEINDLKGPFTAYHFFSGGSGDPNYIHVALQVASNRWQHFGFGEIDKGPLTHSGGAYFVGPNRNFYNIGTSGSPTDTYQSYNSPARQPVPYTGMNDWNVFGNSSEQVYIPDALPVSWSAPKVCCAALTVKPHPTIVTMDRIADWPQIQIESRPLTNVAVSAASSWGGNLVLWPTPIILTKGTQLCYVGDHADVRVANIQGFTPGVEVPYGPDTWMVFPTVSQQPWGNDYFAGYDGVSSAQYGLAYKKVS